MGRRLRFLPPDSLVEVTCRTLQGRLLLKPTPWIADLCRGALARAARLYPVEIHAFVFLGNHYHLLLTAPSAARLAAFMNHLNSSLAREVGRAVGWRERFWGRRYQAIPVTAEPAAQLERLRYLLSHGCKENLVRRPDDWPGASAVRSLRTGEPISGTRVDRTSLYRAARKRAPTDAQDYLSRESLELIPLPCWRGLGPEDRRARIADLLGAIEADATRSLRAAGREPLGRSRLQTQDPHQAPNRIARRPAPLVHAASKAVRNSWRQAYRRFVHAFRMASARFRRGAGLDAFLELFPVGSFLPPGPFVGQAEFVSD